MKTALVTGAAQRIGQSIAVGLAADGWHVIVHYNQSSAAAEATVAEIVQAGGGATALSADLGDPQACQNLIQESSAASGQLTCLVNNASLFVEDRIDDVTAATFDDILSVNLRAPVLLSRAFAA